MKTPWEIVQKQLESDRQRMILELILCGYDWKEDPNNRTRRTAFGWQVPTSGSTKDWLQVQSYNQILILHKKYMTGRV